MTVYITAIGASSISAHEHIATVRWVDSANSTSNTMSVARAVQWMRDGNQMVVAGESGPVEVQVVNVNPPHLRTVANGKWADNLLALPRF